jgi:hypothetical protein
MSSLFDKILDLAGIGGTENTSTATASNDVTVNPEITSINVVDTEALAEALVISQAIQADASERQAVNWRSEITDLLKLAGAGLVFIYAMRKAT